jgi:hypothetical protein
MKTMTTILAAIAALVVTLLIAPSSADARAHRHWHQYGDYALYQDYSYGNVQSPWTYIYPAANWGPFFRGVRHCGPVAPYALPTS